MDLQNSYRFNDYWFPSNFCISSKEHWICRMTCGPLIHHGHIIIGPIMKSTRSVECTPLTGPKQWLYRTPINTPVHTYLQWDVLIWTLPMVLQRTIHLTRVFLRLHIYHGSLFDLHNCLKSQRHNIMILLPICEPSLTGFAKLSQS